MRVEDKIWRLVARKLAGEASASEVKELDKWLIQYPDFGVYVQLLSKSQLAQNPSPADEFLQSLRKKLASDDYNSMANYMFEDKFCTRIVLSQQSKMDITFYLFLN